MIYIIGLPHAHIIIQLSNMPNYEDKEDLSDWIDNNLSAEYPTIDSSSSEEDRQYYEMIQKYMIHKCSSGTPNSCLDSDGVCSKHFTCNKVQSKTSFNERGFPEYKRTNRKFLKFFPHHKKIISMEWSCKC